MLPDAALRQLQSALTQCCSDCYVNANYQACAIVRLTRLHHP